LATSLRASVDARSPRRRPSRGGARSYRSLAVLAAIALVIAYFARRPALARAALGAIILAAGFGLVAHVASRRPSEERARSESLRQAVIPPPRPATAQSERDGIGALIDASIDRRVAPTRAQEERDSLGALIDASTGRRSDPAPALDERASLDALINSVPAHRGEEASASPVRAPTPERSTVTPRDPALEAWFIKAYLRCWTPPATLPQGEKYAPQIRVVHNSDGSLSAPPRLVNPPGDPEWRPYADSALRAVNKCNPLQVPARYLAHFDQWRKLTLHFSPDGAL
jgi:hypothetical protein